MEVASRALGKARASRRRVANAWRGPYHGMRSSRATTSVSRRAARTGARIGVSHSLESAPRPLDPCRGRRRLRGRHRRLEHGDDGSAGIHRRRARSNRGGRIAIALLALLAASDIGITVVNLWVTHFATPACCPDSNSLDGVPSELRTLVAVPILLDRRGGHRGARPRPRGSLPCHSGRRHSLCAALRLARSDSEAAPEDESCWPQPLAGIARLNKFTRQRAWATIASCCCIGSACGTRPKEGGWVGSASAASFMNSIACCGVDETRASCRSTDIRRRCPAGVRYVISLDADTRLPRGAALALIGKMAHPLNQAGHRRRAAARDGGLRDTPAARHPVPARGPRGLRSSRVSSPDRAASILTHSPSRTSIKTCSARALTAARESMTLRHSRSTLADRVGENRLLSHDLFEGIYARCGLASDVEVVEEYPVALRRGRGAATSLDTRRLAVAALGAAGDAVDARSRTLENVRQSAPVPAGARGSSGIRALLDGTRAPSPGALFFAATIALPVLLPFLVDLAADGLSESPAATIARHAEAQADRVLIALRLVFWADQAWLMCDAIFARCTDLAISRRNLAGMDHDGTIERGARDLTRFSFYRRMSGGVLLSLGLTLFLLAGARGFPGLPRHFLLAWLCAPAVARPVSLPARPAARESLSCRAIVTVCASWRARPGAFSIRS